MSRPKFPVGTALTPNAIRAIKEEQRAHDRNPEEYDRHKKDWSLDECIARGCLPTGEPIEALYGTGWWSENH